jgi:hypothetical protein
MDSTTEGKKLNSCVEAAKDKEDKEAAQILEENVLCLG